MPFAQFRAAFPDIAENETRSFTVFENNDWKLPPDTYVFFELYCNEKKCDCRRVFFDVFSTTREKSVAIIAFGWEAEKFYAKWLRDNDPDMLRELQGPSLNIGSPQSEIAEKILKLVSEALKDPVYLERIKSHYQMYRNMIDGKKEPTDIKLQKKRRRRIKKM